MQSDRHSVCSDVVLDSVKMAFMDEDNRALYNVHITMIRNLDYVCKEAGNCIAMIRNIYNYDYWLGTSINMIRNVYNYD